MRILLTIPNFRTAGSQYVLLSLYRLYKLKYPETFILIEDTTGLFPLEVASEDRLVISKKGYLSLPEGIKYSRKLAKIIKTNKINVIHSWDYRSEIWEALACKFAGVPYVYTKKNNAWSRKWWMKSFLASHIAYDHPDMGKRFFNTSALNKKATLIVHGVDPAVFKPVAIKKERTFIIGCIGNIGVNKNQLLILQALAHCKLNIQCHFYGNADQEYLKKMQEFIAENDLQGKVVFKGFVENSSLPSVLNSFDILILASFNEGLPVILLEAIACGVFCIASDSGGGSRYILNNCGSGEIFDPNDYLQLSALIQNFYSTSSPASEMTEMAIANVRANFSSQKEADKYLELFEKL